MNMLDFCAAQRKSMMNARGQRRGRASRTVQPDYLLTRKTGALNHAKSGRNVVDGYHISEILK
jgi:hypothetical protein